MVSIKLERELEMVSCMSHKNRYSFLSDTSANDLALPILNIFSHNYVAIVQFITSKKRRAKSKATQKYSS